MRRVAVGACAKGKGLPIRGLCAGPRRNGMRISERANQLAQNQAVVPRLTLHRPVQTTSQQSGQWRRSSAGNGAALMAHLAALGDPLRPGLSMNSLAWPSCSDGTKSGVGLPKKQSGWERQTNWKSSVVFFFSKINE